MSTIISALLDAIFGSLAEATGLSDWLRQRLGRDPERLAFGAALTQALSDVANQFPGRDLRYFTEMLPQFAGPLLARYLQPAASLPTSDELTHLWLNHLTIDSAIVYRQEFAAFATHFLDRLAFHLENQGALQWVVQTRRQRSSEEATQRMAAAAEQSAASVEALRQEFESLTLALETILQANSHSSVYTNGGTYVDGDVCAQNFAGRDLTIKNYFVQGLPRLVIDYSSRIQDFLLEYLGSKRKRVPFGGRQQQLAELDAWLDDPTAPPYYLMSAEAGRGKSALVCRWLAQLTTHSDLEVIFVPISIRFETATQEVVFAALAVRLARLYESEPDKLPPASLTSEQWKGICQSYLRRELPTGKKLVVILDGLDEATGWSPNLNLFSADPPTSLRVLVTARTRPGETDTSGWVNTLGWGNPKLAYATTLLPLKLQGVEEALASMGNPLDKLATNVDVVGELHRLSEGDPLLVRLYVDALVAQHETIHQLEAEALHSIQPGLAGYFERWWQDQQEQWRLEGCNPIIEQANLRLILNAIAAALGPVTLDDLASLHPALGDGMLVRRLIQQVSRWLVGDGKQQGYSYNHPRLGTYFWELLSKQEQRSWDERFMSWGEQVLIALNNGTILPNVAASYPLYYYSTHLERYDAQPDRFYGLVSNGWRKAWKYLDISYAGFLNDVNRARKRAEEMNDSTQPERAKALTQQVKAAFCRSIIATLGSSIPPRTSKISCEI
ncbi:MAG: ATP-binding protein [Caldilineaceae bacterium]